MYVVYSGVATPTTVLPAAAWGTALKTILQLSAPSDRSYRIDEWGYQLDAAPSAVSTVELVSTTAVAATSLTTLADADVYKLDAADSNSGLTFGTSNTGFLAGAEGTVTAVRVFDIDITPANPTADRLRYEKVFMPDKRPKLPASNFLRIRADLGSAANGLAWIKFSLA